MRRPLLVAGLIVICGLPLVGAGVCQAGMPALLPTSWTADKATPSWASRDAVDSEHGAERWQALSFFAACLFLSACGVKAVWNSLQRDLTALPRLSYGRALSLVVLWGLCFVVVLTMISGARELMTPGAWKKQGWTYSLADAKPADSPDIRRPGLERLRFALWQYAATHEGQFPSEGDDAIEPSLWDVPGSPGVRFLYVSGQSAGQSGNLLIFEPDLNGDDRLVLLTNGFVGTMRTAEIERLLSSEDAAP